MEQNASLNHAKTTKIVLSTKFSLAAKSSEHATKFTVSFKKHPYITGGSFAVYSPNAFNKGTCDPNWTDKSWACRGTYSTCQKPEELKTGVPKEAECCWRYSFRYHLKEASQLGGFMIQVVDKGTKEDMKDERPVQRPVQWAADSRPVQGQREYGYRCEGIGLYKSYALGDGQAIETEMAQEEKVKIFRFFESRHLLPHLYDERVDKFVLQIQKWYNDGCKDMAECDVHPRLERAQYEGAAAQEEISAHKDSKESSMQVESSMHLASTRDPRPPSEALRAAPPSATRIQRKLKSLLRAQCS